MEAFFPHPFINQAQCYRNSKRRQFEKVPLINLTITRKGAGGLHRVMLWSVRLNHVSTQHKTGVKCTYIIHVSVFI